MHLSEGHLAQAEVAAGLHWAATCARMHINLWYRSLPQHSSSFNRNDEKSWPKAVHFAQGSRGKTAWVSSH